MSFQKASLRGLAALLGSSLFIGILFHWIYATLILSLGSSLFCFSGGAFFLLLEQEVRAEEDWKAVRFLAEDPQCTTEEIESALEKAKKTSSFYF